MQARELTGKIDQAIDSLTQAKRTAMQAQRDHRDLNHRDLSLTGKGWAPYGFVQRQS
jgi:hypothetical protein